MGGGVVPTRAVAVGVRVAVLIVVRRSCGGGLVPTRAVAAAVVLVAAVAVVAGTVVEVVGGRAKSAEEIRTVPATVGVGGEVMLANCLRLTSLPDR